MTRLIDFICLEIAMSCLRARLFNAVILMRIVFQMMTTDGGLGTVADERGRIT